MTLEGPRPQRSDPQRIGGLAKKCLSSNVPDAWVPKELDGDEDYGYDYLVQVVIGDEVWRSFRLQLKGSTAPDRSAGDAFFSVALKSSTVRMYSDCTDPIMLVLADLSSGRRPKECPLYYTWIHDELRRLNDGALSESAQSTTLRIPTGSRLDEATDVNGELERFGRLAKVGEALDLIAGQVIPEANEFARSELVQRIPEHLARASPSLFLSLSEEPKLPWPEAPLGSFAWLLNEATAELRQGDWRQAQERLNAASALGSTNPLEHANHAFLTGRILTRQLDDHGASAAYLQAATLCDVPRYWLAWAEAQIRLRFELDKAVDFSDVIARLPGDDPAIQGMRARLLGAERKFDEALKVAERIEGPERFVAQGLTYTLLGDTVNTENACSEGLAASDLRDANKVTLLMLRARALFQSAVGQHVDNAGDGIIPPSGPAGTDIPTLQRAWADITAAVRMLRATGWPPNIELLADVWVASASILGKLKDVLPLMIEAGRSGNSLPMLQHALEMAATHQSAFDVALEANARRPESDDQALRRTLLMNLAEKHPECVEQFQSKGENAARDEPMFYAAVTAAIRSAERTIRPDLVQDWEARFGNDPLFAQRRVTLDYLRAVDTNLLAKEQALDALLDHYQRLGEPAELGMLLIVELDSSSKDGAERVVELAEHMMTERLLPSEGLLCYCQALATLDRWPQLLDYCRAQRPRFDARHRIVAVEAVALDKLGRTAEAIAALSDLLKAGVNDRFAVNAYVNMVLRCGLEKEAVRAVESLIAGESSSERKVEALRLLFVLVQHSEPASPRLAEVAWRLGHAVDRGAEDQEGLFLMLMFSATLRVNIGESDGRAAEFRERMEAFVKRFPESKILKSVSFPTQASPAQIIALLRRETGWSEEREQNRQRLENQLQHGEVPIPYAWRPKHVLLNIPDLPTLWEVSKRTQHHLRQYHLTMTPGDWKHRSSEEVTRYTPLIDLITLLLLHDLGLLALIFRLFDRVAIAQATLTELSYLVSPMSGTMAREQCISLRKVLKEHLQQIVQPWNAGNDPEALLNGKRASEQVRALAASGRYQLYSDDFFFRLYCVDQSSEQRGLCTLDILRACEDRELITTVEAAAKIALLASWRVSFQVEMRYQIAVLPEGLRTVRSVGDGIDVLRSSVTVTAIFDAIWNPDKSTKELLSHASAVLWRTVSDANNRVMSIAALLGLWFNKIRLHRQLPTEPETMLAQLIILAARQNLPAVNAGIAGRLWEVYRRLVEFHYGDAMSVPIERRAIGLIAELSAQIDHKTNAHDAQSLRARMACGLTDGTAEYDAFMSPYAAKLRVLKSEAGEPRS